MSNPARVIGAVAIVAALVTADLRFIRRPEPHSVAELNPFKARLGSEELVLSGPVSRAGPLLSHQGGNNEEVDLYFQRGILSDQLRALLGKQVAQSAGPQQISYITLNEPGAKGEPCRTSVDIMLENERAPEIHLMQQGVAGGQYHREIEVKAAASRMVAEFLTTSSDPTRLHQPGCLKLLQVGESQVRISGTPLRVLAAAGSSLRLKFMPASGALWNGANGLFEPFGAINLYAKGVLIRPIDSRASLWTADTADGKPSIRIDDLLVGSDSFQARLSGVVTRNGRSVSPTLGEWISSSAWRAGLTLFVNLLVLCGALYLARSRRAIGAPPRISLTPVPDQPCDGLKVFLCHCSENKVLVRDLEQKLKSWGFCPWLDEHDIPPAREWEDQIRDAIHRSDAVVVCLSEVFATKVGFVQKELKWVLDRAAEQPEGATYLIPARLEDCSIPRSLERLQYIDLFQPGGHERLQSALLDRSRQVGRAQAASA